MKLENKGLSRNIVYWKKCDKRYQKIIYNDCDS